MAKRIGVICSTLSKPNWTTNRVYKMWQEIISNPGLVFLIAGITLIIFSLLIAAKFQGLIEIKFIEENNSFLRNTSFLIGLFCISFSVAIYASNGNVLTIFDGPNLGEGNGEEISETQPGNENGDSGISSEDNDDKGSETQPEIESSTQLVGWEHFQESDSQVQDFSQDNRGFSLVAASIGKSDPQYIGIQVVSISSVDLSNPGDYKLNFAIKSDQSFLLVVRIGQKAAPYTSALNEGKIFVSGDGSYEEKEISFQVADISDAFLHFQLGNVPPGSEISLRDINLIRLSG